MSEWRGVYQNPVVLLAVVIIMSIIALIGAAVVGWDRGNVLLSMGRSDFARGLITYLFAIVTICIAVALMLSAVATPRRNPKRPRTVPARQGNPVALAWRIRHDCRLLFWIGRVQCEPPGIATAAAFDTRRHAVSVFDCQLRRKGDGAGSRERRHAALPLRSVAQRVRLADPRARGGRRRLDHSRCRAEGRERGTARCTIRIVVQDAAKRGTEQATAVQVVK